LASVVLASVVLASVVLQINTGSRQSEDGMRTETSTEVGWTSSLSAEVAL